MRNIFLKTMSSWQSLITSSLCRHHSGAVLRVATQCATKRGYCERLSLLLMLMLASIKTRSLMRMGADRASPIKGAAFPFTYIEPQKPENAAIIAPYNTKHVPMTAFAPIGAPAWHVNLHWLQSCACRHLLCMLLHLRGRCGGCCARASCTTQIFINGGVPTSKHALIPCAQIKAGNAPVMIHKNLLEGIVDDWYSTSLRCLSPTILTKAAVFFLL